jgi:hypothetical protein
VAWSLFGEVTDKFNSDPMKRMDPVMIDWRQSVQSQAVILAKPVVRCSIQLDGTWYGPYENECMSPVTLADMSTPVSVIDPGSTRIKFDFGWEGSPPLSLQATPYVDDVTLFYDGADTGYVSSSLE